MGPDLPEEVGFGLLAAPKHPYTFALYSCEGLTEAPPNTTRVSERLDELLSSAEAWPPALAGMRLGLSTKEVASIEEFLSQVEDHLSSYLSRQPEHPAFLARAVVTEIGYKFAGGYYWIVGYRLREPPLVRWVSRDYFVYEDDASDFDVSLEELVKRFPPKERAKN